MQARMPNPAVTVPGVMQALGALHGASEASGLATKTAALVQLRASQINGCSLCVDMHARQMLRTGESTERVVAVAAWRDAP